MFDIDRVKNLEINFLTNMKQKETKIDKWKYQQQKNSVFMAFYMNVLYDKIKQLKLKKSLL